MTYNGICIVPVQRKSLATGTVQEILSLSYLDALIDYANRKSLAVLYLSKSAGIVHYDDFIQYEPDVPVNLNLWQSVVAEQIGRLCIQFSTPEVHLMCQTRVEYEGIVSKLRSRGVRVTTPILGYKSNVVSRVLLIV